MMQIRRRKARVIKIGKVAIGGNNPIAIQSMTKTKTSDIEKTVRHTKDLESAGCEIVRLAVRDEEDSRAIRKIKEKIGVPLVADIHFNWRLAIDAIDNGADKIRLNPGNIYRKEELREIARAAKLNDIPIRIGVNSGSIIRVKGQGLRVKGQAEAMIKSALDYIRVLEGFKFYDIVVSLKASNILDTIDAYRKIAGLCDYPLHLGVTATGAPYTGTIKSAIALGTLLLEGIGDTIRISLTDKPVHEVAAAKIILGTLKIRSFGPEIISCPTCGRCEVNLVEIVRNLEDRLTTDHVPLTAKPTKVAIMGCVVNGPGEAREADIGIAFGKKEGLLFKKGKPVGKVSFNNCVDILLKEIKG
jgi:(E)-4-hydroxy-3-methylbut-2-enyl-diphosphate synthase